MTMIKNSVIECFILLLCACTVFIYKLPNTINTWLLNSIVIVVMKEQIKQSDSVLFRFLIIFIVPFVETR